MKYEFSFDKLIEYNIGKAGISLDVELRLNESAVTFEAKLDTGSSKCIFEKKYGEELGFDIEAGELRYFGTSVGSFPASDIGLR